MKNSEIDEDYIRALAGSSAWKIAEPLKKSNRDPKQENMSREGVGAEVIEGLVKAPQEG